MSALALDKFKSYFGTVPSSCTNRPNYRLHSKCLNYVGRVGNLADYALHDSNIPIQQPTETAALERIPFSEIAPRY